VPGSKRILALDKSLHGKEKALAERRHVVEIVSRPKHRDLSPSQFVSLFASA
jgi:hypothetical protein